MSGVVLHQPVATARPPHGWSFRHLYRTWRAHRRGGPVVVAILHAADLPPT